MRGVSTKHCTALLLFLALTLAATGVLQGSAACVGQQGDCGAQWGIRSELGWRKTAQEGPSGQQAGHNHLQAWLAAKRWLAGLVAQHRAPLDLKGLIEGHPSSGPSPQTRAQFRRSGAIPAKYVNSVSRRQLVAPLAAPGVDLSREWPATRRDTSWLVGGRPLLPLPKPLPFSDFLLVIPTQIDRLHVSHAHRVWTRLGAQTVLVVRANETVLDVLNEEGKPHREVYVNWRDNDPGKSHTSGDDRAALAPFLAHAAVPAGSYKWMLYGDDDTLFNIKAFSYLLPGWDPDLPYWITDHTMMEACDREGKECWRSFPQPAPLSPRCLPCQFQTPWQPQQGQPQQMQVQQQGQQEETQGQRRHVRRLSPAADEDASSTGDTSSPVDAVATTGANATGPPPEWDLPAGCHCTRHQACLAAEWAYGSQLATRGKKVQQLCTFRATHAFHYTKFHAFGGAGMVFARAVFGKVPGLQSVEEAQSKLLSVRRSLKTKQDLRIGGDGLLTGILGRAGLAPTDPGVHTATLRKFHRVIMSDQLEGQRPEVPYAFGSSSAAPEAWAAAVIKGQCSVAAALQELQELQDKIKSLPGQSEISNFLDLGPITGTWLLPYAPANNNSSHNSTTSPGTSNRNGDGNDANSGSGSSPAVDINVVGMHLRQADRLARAVLDGSMPHPRGSRGEAASSSADSKNTDHNHNDHDGNANHFVANATATEAIGGGGEGPWTHPLLRKFNGLYWKYKKAYVTTLKSQHDRTTRTLLALPPPRSPLVCLEGLMRTSLTAHYSARNRVRWGYDPGLIMAAHHMARMHALLLRAWEVVEGEAAAAAAGAAAGTVGVTATLASSTGASDVDGVGAEGGNAGRA